MTQKEILDKHLNDLFIDINENFQDELNKFLSFTCSVYDDLNNIDIIKDKNGNFFNIFIDYRININNINKEVQWDYIEDYCSDSMNPNCLYLKNINLHEIWYDIINEPSFFFELDRLQDKLNEHFEIIEKYLVKENN